MPSVLTANPTRARSHQGHCRRVTEKYTSMVDFRCEDSEKAIRDGPGSNQRAVLLKRNRVNLFAVALLQQQFLPLLDVPKSPGAVVRSGTEVSPRRVEIDPADSTFMAGQCPQRGLAAVMQVSSANVPLAARNSLCSLFEVP